MARPSVLCRFFAVALVTLVAGACSPLDDFMVFVFGRSMRDQVSFDPYENPRPAPEGSVPFASGNFPAEEGEVNIGQPEILEDAPPPGGTGAHARVWAESQPLRPMAHRELRPGASRSAGSTPSEVDGSYG